MAVIKYYDGDEWQIASTGLGDPNTPIVAITGDRTLQLSDAIKLIKCTSSSLITVTVPPYSSVAFPVGTEIVVVRYGTGNVTIGKGSGVTVNSSGSKLSIANQYEAATLKNIAQDEWILIGSLTTI